MASATSKRTARAAGPKVDPLAAMVDELGALENELAPFALKIARVEHIRKALREHFATSPAGRHVSAEGLRFGVIMGACGLQRTISITSLVKSIGLKAFAAFASCTLKSLEANVAPDVVAACTHSAPTGPRTITIFEKGIPK